MYSGLIYATSLPAAVDALKIPLLKRFQSYKLMRQMVKYLAMREIRIHPAVSPESIRPV
jgi:hypothetical protein